MQSSCLCALFEAPQLSEKFNWIPLPDLPARAPGRLALPIHWGLAMTWRPVRHRLRLRRMPGGLGRRAGSQWQAGRVEDPPIRQSPLADWRMGMTERGLQ